MYEGGIIREECRVREEGMVYVRGGHYQGRVQGEGRGYGIMYEGGTIRDECRVREEGMVLCTRGAPSGMSAG